MQDHISKGGMIAIVDYIGLILYAYTYRYMALYASLLCLSCYNMYGAYLLWLQAYPAGKLTAIINRHHRQYSMVDTEGLLTRPCNYRHT